MRCGGARRRRVSGIDRAMSFPFDGFFFFLFFFLPFSRAREASAFPSETRKVEAGMR